MKINIFACSLMVMLGLGAAAPVLAVDKETRQLMADIRMMQEQSQQLQTLIAQLTDAVKTVDSRLTARIDDQITTTRKGLADQKLIIDNVSSDLRVLREKVDDNNVRVGSLTQEVAALRQLVTQLNTARTTTFAPDDSTAAATGGSSPTDAAGATAGASPISAGASPQALFDAAWSDYTSGQYGLAISGFENYIRSFPRSEQAATAQVNIGESYFNQGQYPKAVESYDTAIRNYPGSTALPIAYYHKGLALQNLNRKDEAIEAFNTVLKSYPDTDAAVLANQRLPELTGTKK